MIVLAVPTIETLPAASSGYAGDLLRVSTAGDESYTAICLKDAAGVYQWVVWAVGGTI